MRKNRTFCVAAAFAFAATIFTISQTQAEAEDYGSYTTEYSVNIPEPVLLWPDGAPGATGDSQEDKPAFYPFLPDEGNNTGTAMIVAPGGGFTHRCMDYEGVVVAQWLKERGIAAFVLRYRITPLYSRPDAQVDGQRLVRYLRANSDRFNISPDRIGMMGFSAGGELTTMVGLNPEAGDPDAADPIDRQSSALNFMAPIYGVSRGTVSAENTPATFMFCTAEDRGHATAMINLYWEMYQAGVPSEVHFFNDGQHGVGLAQGDRSLGQWPRLMFNWMLDQGFLTSARRVTVSGRVNIDGEPLPHGSVTFVPVDIPGAPPVTAYILNDRVADASFSVNENRGPVPGKYRVEIRQDAEIWVSNSRDPFRRLPFEERAAGLRQPGWGAPTIDKMYLFTKERPDATNDLMVEIKAGENEINFAIFSK